MVSYKFMIVCDNMKEAIGFTYLFSLFLLNEKSKRKNERQPIYKGK
jgi:hypothetical protein